MSSVVPGTLYHAVFSSDSSGDSDATAVKFKFCLMRFEVHSKPGYVIISRELTIYTKDYIILQYIYIDCMC